MPDDIDRATEIADRELARRLAAARIDEPSGEPGECDACGEWSPRLVHHRCAPCRTPRRTIGRERGRR